jgi:hypothetical protein
MIIAASCNAIEETWTDKDGVPVLLLTGQAIKD